jgi:hypothetical protein
MRWLLGADLNFEESARTVSPNRLIVHVGWRHAALLGTWFFVVSCGRPVTVVEAEKKDEVAQKAAFALDCPREKLNLKCTGHGNIHVEGSYYEGVCTSYGVRGCDRQVEFLYVDGTGWANNTGVVAK